MKTTYAGIDYGFGRTNRDEETGIRFGTIPHHDLAQSWYDGSEADYGSATCGECGNEAVDLDQVPFDLDDLKTVRKEGFFREHDVLEIPEEFREACGDNEEWDDEGRDHACLGCARSFDSEDAFGDEPLGFNLDDGEYLAHQGGDDTDVVVLKSPYYTRAQFCSPCMPGGGYLRKTPVKPCPYCGGAGQRKIRPWGEVPCAICNGRGHLYTGPRAYCFGPDWFRAHDEDEITGEYCGEATSCPYPVWTVDGDVLVFEPKGRAVDESD